MSGIAEPPDAGGLSDLDEREARNAENHTPKSPPPGGTLPDLPARPLGPSADSGSELGHRRQDSSRSRFPVMATERGEIMPRRSLSSTSICRRALFLFAH